MTKLLTNKDNPFAGTLHGFNQLPALFNEHWLKDVFATFDKWDKAFDLQNVHYPYNISYIKDEKDNPICYRLDVALAGIGKDNVKLSVKDQHLLVEVERPNKTPLESEAVWLKNGISYRSAKLQFQLGKDVDVDNISSSYKDGILRVSIPIKRVEVKNIQIIVD